MEQCIGCGKPVDPKAEDTGAESVPYYTHSGTTSPHHWEHFYFHWRCRAEARRRIAVARDPSAVISQIRPEDMPVDVTPIAGAVAVVLGPLTTWLVELASGEALRWYWTGAAVVAWAAVGYGLADWLLNVRRPRRPPRRTPS